MRVVKLGGSLADWEDLPGCLALLATQGAVIVPGGGGFADQVRAAQRRWRFDDRTAHAMAILAMSQFGLMLAGLQKTLHTAGDPERLREAAASGRSTVWLPTPERLPAESIEASWDVTSDSLAAWLATRVQATDLILVKSAPLPPGALTLERLMAAGLVDRAMGCHTRGARFSLWLCHRDDYRSLAWNTPDFPAKVVRVVC